MSRNSNNSNLNDLTEGPIVKKLIAFFLPIVAGTLVQQLYNTVDAVVVSKFVGKAALAAVGGSPGVLSNLIIGFCTALSAGCAVVIAQLFGAGEKEKVRTAVKTSVLFCAVLGLVIGIAVVLISPQLLLWLKTPEDSFDLSLLYQRIYFAGSFFILTFNMGAGILRAVGDSRYPFICLFISCGTNIVLDVLFVAVFGMGVAGVALATVIATALSTVLIFRKLLTVNDCYKLTFRGTPFSGVLLKKMLLIGIPAGIQNSMYGFSNIILQVSINKIGTTAAAAWAMSGKVDGVYWAVSDAFGTSLTTFIGQNYGANRHDRVRLATRKGLLVFLGITAGIDTFLLPLGRLILRLMSDDADVRELTWIIMLYCVPAYIIYTVIAVFSSALRGVGDTLVPSVILAVGICATRIVWIYTAHRVIQTVQSVCLSYPISWAITMVAILIYYGLKIKKNGRLTASEK